MGSEQFPDENDYDAYLQSHGGSANAFTELVRTKSAIFTFHLALMFLEVCCMSCSGMVAVIRVLCANNHPACYLNRSSQIIILTANQTHCTALSSDFRNSL